MSKANAEQLKAIEHRGGVLLKAGAGSGKTFVLVEHIQYLVSKWIAEYEQRPIGSIEDFLRTKFSEVVMMTFTRKAAGEMNIRLTEKFTKLSEQGQAWASALEVLPSLTVTTIDGFCRSLITEGYFPHLSTEANIIFETERLEQVVRAFDRWYETHIPSLPSDLAQIVTREKSQLLRSMCDIFNDPSLRLEWKKFDPNDLRPERLADLLKKSFELNDLEAALHKILLLDLPHEAERSAFEKKVGELHSLGLHVVDSVEKLKTYETYFAAITRLAGESPKKKTPQHEAALEGMKALREWVKEWAPIVADYTTHYQDKILPWNRLCQQIFEYVEAKLDPNQGVTFGDITYNVALGLESREIRERIQKVYKYFIVDEFQDTSALQFKIIEFLLGGDYRRLFCVGDSKQAIYGFRGGELSVFQDCASLVPTVLSLVNNYRSLPQVIRFNNSLFRSVLPSGQGFAQHDPFSVEAEDQDVPPGIEFSTNGKIEAISVDLPLKEEDSLKYTSGEINDIEARVLAEAIAQQRAERPDEVCTILYRKLGPSSSLLRELMSLGVGFTAQFKIDLLDDPMIGMFLLLLGRKFDRNPQTRDRFPELMLRSYLSLLEVPLTTEGFDFSEFDQNVRYWGLFEAFKKFIFSLGVTNENADINLDLIETLSTLYQQDPESIYVQLTQGANQKKSLDFRSGKNSDKVLIMTAHASKGLEFDTVYLAGIYTNGRENPDRDMFGDHPGSFYWYLDLSQRDKRKSPQYVFESEMNAYKNFSESKRLFYVACTRAKKKLSWVDLENAGDVFAVPKNSWIQGIRLWGHETKDVDVQKALVKKKAELPLMNGSSVSTELPLFYRDPVGIFPKGSAVSALAIAGELSVTRLNSLIDCPRKFYLQNTLKLTPTAQDKILPGPDADLEEIQVVSSAHRGTEVHALIARGIQENFIVPREAFNGPNHKPLDWILSELKSKTGEFEFESEKSVKFPLFDFMVSGIPDLILSPRQGQATEIWDFKTGQINQLNLSHYWVQLKVYAYALYQLKRVEAQKKIKLVLSFVDVQKHLVSEVSLSEITDELFELWKSQNQPWKTNPDHCAQCAYGDICPR